MVKLPALHRRRLAAGFLLGGALLLGACATTRRGPVLEPADRTPRFAPGLTELGRVFTVDAAGAAVVVELSPFAAPWGAPQGQALLARDPSTLEPRARLRASSRRSGAMLGAWIESGAPRPGDEVVLAPEEPVAPAPAPAP